MRALATWIAIGWAALTALSLVSMMTVFMNESDGQLDGLLRTQLAALPLLLVALVVYVWRARRFAGEQGALRALWDCTPGWLVFAVASAASLTLIAELTFALIGLLKAEPQPWMEHVPAIMALLSALAMATAVASLRLESAQDRSTDARRPR